MIQVITGQTVKRTSSACFGVVVAKESKRAGNIAKVPWSEVISIIAACAIIFRNTSHTTLRAWQNNFLIALPCIIILSQQSISFWNRLLVVTDNRKTSQRLFVHLSVI